MTTKYFGGQPPWKAYPFPNSEAPSWLPDDDGQRCATYDSLESVYWSEDASYTLRVLVTEQPIYSPNARIVVDTISHFLLKGLCIGVEDPEKNVKESDDLQAFLKREMFYPRFHTAKHSGCFRGDFCLHMTADPSKPAGKRISLTSVHPGKVVRKFDDDDGEHVTEAWICEPYTDPDNEDQDLVRRLHYWYVEDDTDTSSDDPDSMPSDLPSPEEADITRANAIRYVWSEEAIYKNNGQLWTDEAEVYGVINEAAALPEQINHIPLFWFKNIPTDGQPFGSSDIRGLERIIRGVSQQVTDLNVAMALDGLGQYVTDAPPPAQANGVEGTWTIEPGQVQQVPNGNFFKRVEGVGSVQPMLDTVAYSETKIKQAAGISAAALGDVPPATANNPMALAINFLPTLAKIQERDLFGIARLQHVFWQWTQFREAYEDEEWPAGVEISVEIGEKMPQDRTARVNELNNMLDRDVISRAYYREEMTKLGYEFPDDIAAQVTSERKADLKLNEPTGQTANVPAQTALAAAAQALQGGAGQGDPEQMPGGVNGQKSSTLPPTPNQSNNKSKTNESDGTESGQALSKQTAAKKA